MGTSYHTKAERALLISALKTDDFHDLCESRRICDLRQAVHVGFVGRDVHFPDALAWGCGSMDRGAVFVVGGLERLGCRIPRWMKTSTCWPA